MISLRNKVSYLWAAAMVFITLILDQATKVLVVQNIPYHGEIKIIPGLLNLVYIRNRGAAFGFLSGARGNFWPPFFLILTLVATAFVLFLLVRTIRQKQTVTFSLALILGGALGNLVDRIRSGSVVDFMDLHLYNVHWPAFNLADTAITIGGILLLIHLIFSPDGFPKSADSQ
jgi:signal peptidase II